MMCGILAQSIVVWFRTPDGRDVQRDVDDAVALVPGASPPVQPLAGAGFAGPVVQPVAPSVDTLAVLLLPPDLAGQVTRNGVPVPPGACPLHHADRVDVRGQPYWLAARSCAVRTEYDPAVHGEGVHCFLTKAPLKPGQQIVVCPGRPGRPCGVIYKVEAWDMAMRPGSELRCANCGFRPDEAKWAPPEMRRKRRTVDELLARL